MTDKVFNKGYLLEVVSWENDGDNYKTEDLQCTDLEYLKAIVECLKYFKSGTNSKEVLFGNKEVPMYEDTGNSVEKMLFGVLSEKTNLTHEIIEEIIEITLFDLIGVWADGEYFRVLDSFSIYEVPETIIFKQIEL